MSKVIYNADGKEIKPGICCEETIQVPMFYAVKKIEFDVLAMHSQAAGYRTSWPISRGQLEFSFVFKELDVLGLIERSI